LITLGTPNNTEHKQKRLLYISIHFDPLILTMKKWQVWNGKLLIK